MTTHFPAVIEIAEGALDAGNRVATLDRDGRCVTLDLYALGLDAARRDRVHPVRALTAAIDLLWGLRDYVRGHKKGVVMFGSMVVASSDQEWSEMYA
jgi:hypothetical protein